MRNFVVFFPEPLQKTFLANSLQKFVDLSDHVLEQFLEIKQMEFVLQQTAVFFGAQRWLAIQNFH